MRSIRLSLMVYFLILLALGLGAVSLAFYARTQQLQKELVKARGNLLQVEHAAARESELKKIDNLLEGQAKYLAGHAEFQYKESRTQIDVLASVGMLNAGLNPSLYPFLAPLWYGVGERPPIPLAWRLRRILSSQVRFDEQGLAADPSVTEYFQINTSLGSVWRSRSMGSHTFDVSQEVLDGIPLLEAKFDNLELEPGIRTRRVTWKVPVSQVKFLPRSQFRPGSPRDQPPAGRLGNGDAAGNRPARGQMPPEGAGSNRQANGDSGVRTTPALLIQCAADIKHREAILADLNEKLETDLAELQVNSAANLSELRNRLLLISLATFVATVVGGIGLVRFGLSPLRRLSEAVSQVSAKDFILPLDERRLPRELRPIVERLTETLKLLERAFDREKQAAADISHELRTPLAALLMTLEVGLRKNRSPEEYREMLAECHAAGRQMSQLVERLLALARLDGGVDTLRPQNLDASHLVEQCASLVRPLADARGLEIQVKRNGSILCRTDPNKLREVVTNLLHNAIEYNRPQGRVEVSVKQENGELDLEVRDTGIGIAPGAFPHLFERFYRADPSRHADGLHAGLGLAIVKGYLDLMAGSITVESKEGEGTTFHVRLPVSPAARKVG